MIEVNKAILNQLIVYAIISFGGWLFAYIGIAGIREARKRQDAENAITTARVVEHVKYQKRSRQVRSHVYTVYTYWRAVLEFDAEGRHYRLEGVVQEGKPAVGETVDIWYAPKDPTHFHQEGQLERGLRNDAIVAVLGVLWGILSVFFTMKVFGK